MAKKKRTNRGRGSGSNGQGSQGGGNGKPRARRRRRGGGGGGHNNNSGEPADIPSDAPLEEGEGILELHPNGYGFLRSQQNNYSRERSDPFVPGTMIERFGLRQGVYIKAMVQQARRQQGPRVREILDVDGMSPESYPEVKSFDSLTPINPEEWLNLERGRKPLTNRVIDLLAPLGKGQRALIVAPPRSGKTVMLQDIASGVAENHPDLKLIVLLIDERPEEVTDMRRNVLGGEVVASSLDMDVESHVRLSQLVIDRARRLAEMGQDVFLMLDSITRLARAFNKWVGRSGRGGATMTGGLDIKAMDIPKKAVRDRTRVPRRRIADDRGNLSGRHEQPNGRSHFPGVQRNRKHGAGLGSKVGRSTSLAIDRYLAKWHTSRRIACTTRKLTKRSRCCAERSAACTRAMPWSS